MNTFEFVIQGLDEIVTRFPNTKVRYENDRSSHTHIIEIVPARLYYDNKEYLSWERSFEDKFAELFPHESLCFITDDEAFGIEHVDVERSGNVFDWLNSIIPFSMIDSIEIKKISIKRELDFDMGSLSDINISSSLSCLSLRNYSHSIRQVKNQGLVVFSVNRDIKTNNVMDDVLFFVPDAA
jgi:hypothetical protein